MTDMVDVGLTLSVVECWAVFETVADGGDRDLEYVPETPIDGESTERDQDLEKGAEKDRVGPLRLMDALRDGESDAVRVADGDAVREFSCENVRVPVASTEKDNVGVWVGGVFVVVFVIESDREEVRRSVADADRETDFDDASENVGVGVGGGVVVFVIDKDDEELRPYVTDADCETVLDDGIDNVGVGVGGGVVVFVIEIDDE